jgi:hypothetical protein
MHAAGGQEPPRRRPVPDRGRRQLFLVRGGLCLQGVLQQRLQLTIDHVVLQGDKLFGFPLNNVIVLQEPISCFREWMEIVVNGMSLVNQVAEFDSFIQILNSSFNGSRDREFSVQRAATSGKYDHLYHY